MTSPRWKQRILVHSESDCVWRLISDCNGFPSLDVDGVGGQEDNSFAGSTSSGRSAGAVLSYLLKSVFNSELKRQPWAVWALAAAISRSDRRWRHTGQEHSERAGGGPLSGQSPALGRCCSRSRGHDCLPTLQREERRSEDEAIFCGRRVGQDCLRRFFSISNDGGGTLRSKHTA